MTTYYLTIRRLYSPNTGKSSLRSNVVSLRPFGPRSSCRLKWRSVARDVQREAVPAKLVEVTSGIEIDSSGRIQGRSRYTLPCFIRSPSHGRAEMQLTTRDSHYRIRHRLYLYYNIGAIHVAPKNPTSAVNRYNARLHGSLAITSIVIYTIYTKIYVTLSIILRPNSAHDWANYIIIIYITVTQSEAFA